MHSYLLGTAEPTTEVTGWLDGLDDDVWVDAALSPFVASLILDEVNWPQSFVINQSARLLRTVPDQRYPWSEVPQELLPILKRMGIGSRRESCEEANFIGAESPEWCDYSTSVKRAMRLIGEATPDYLQQLLTASSAVIFVNGSASFRGASGAPQRGLIFLSPTKDWDEVIFAEELVHETTHCMLDLISICTPLFTSSSAYEEKHRAPFRPDLRAWYGNFHAVVVCARCIGFYRMLRLRRGDLAQRADARIVELRSKAGPVSAELLQAPMSDIAKSIFQQWAVPEFRDWLC